MGPEDAFDDPATRREAAVLGMWVFLLTELLFFGGVFALYAAYRRVHFAAFAAGSAELDAGLGAANTAVLLTSSLSMALGARAAARGRSRAAGGWLAATAALGALFLAVKGVEWAHKAEAGLFPGRFGELPGGERLFFGLYYALTGLHAAHVGIGVAVLLWASARAFRRRWTAERHAPVECAGLYWHFVDIVWIFLFPLLYLIGGRR